MTERPEIVDSHCHLDFPDFADDLPQVIARARAAGVTRMVTIATTLRAEPVVRAIAEAHEGVFFAAGIHPMQVAKEPPATLAALEAVAAHPKCVGIGESGLDYHYTADSAAAQRASLVLHIEAARRTGLPLIVHARDADDDMAAILRREHAAGAFGCVMHCYTSGRALAETALDLGFYLSASGIAAFPRSSDLREILRLAWPDRLLVETDAPYLAPPPHRGKRNEPAHTVHTARALAEAWDVAPAEVARRTTAAFERLFARAAPRPDAARRIA